MDMEISVTPLQAAATYAAITNGGNLIKPTILKNEYKMNKKLYQARQAIKLILC